MNQTKEKKDKDSASPSQDEPAASTSTSVASLSSKLADTALLDMVFVMDCTGSMGSYIHSAQQTIHDLVQEIVSKEKADVRFALVAYRDHPPQDCSYVTQVYEFSSSVKNMRDNLNQLSASGGGDGPEAVVDGLHAALKLDFRPAATKVAILIADAPPHGLGQSGDGFPEGCPCGLDPLAVCRDMAQHGITLYCIGCEPSLSPYKTFFMALCHITGGQYCPLGDATNLHAAVVGGVREEISLERMMKEVNTTLESCSAGMDETAKALRVQSVLKQKGYRTSHLRSDRGESCAILPKALEILSSPDLAHVRAHHAKDMGDAMRARMSPASLHRHASPMALSACVATADAGRLMRKSREVGDGERSGTGAPHDLFASRTMTTAASGSYSVVEDDVSVMQCERMMAKAAARSKRA